MQNICLPNV